MTLGQVALGLVAVAAVAGAYVYVTEEQEKKRRRDTERRYLAMRAEAEREKRSSGIYVSFQDGKRRRREGPFESRTAAREYINEKLSPKRKPRIVGGKN